MKYPKLPPEQDLRRKLMDDEIEQIRQAYRDALPFPDKSEAARSRNLGYPLQTRTSWLQMMADMWDVSWGTIYYYVDDEYRAKMKAKNAKAHSKAKDLKDYEAHRAAEIKHRVERWKRNDDLREWHYRVSAKNEKRRPRYTVRGKPLDE